MGKSAISCFNIISCSRDSAGYDDLDLLESRASLDRRRWSFRKRSARDHILSNNVTSESSPVAGNDKESPEASPNASCPLEDTFSFWKTSSPKKTDEMPQLSLNKVNSEAGNCSHATEEAIKPVPDFKELAATVIEAAIRGYLARKEMQKLKCVIKLQAVVRGHLVRRQAAGTLRCVQAIIKMQTLVRARFVHQSVENFANQRKHDAECERTKPREKESFGTKHRRTRTSTEKLLKNGFARQLLDSTPKTKPIYIDCDSSRSDSAWKWLERWMALASLDILHQQELNPFCTRHDQTKNPKLDISEITNAVPVAVGSFLADTMAVSVMPAPSEQLIINCDNDFEFQTPISSRDECLFPLIKDYQACHQSKNDSLNVAEDNQIKNESMEESSNLNSSEMTPQSSSVLQSPDAMFSKPESGKGKSNLTDSGVDCESLEAEVKTSSLEIRKVCNPAFVAAQSKFKELCSAGSLKSVSTDTTLGSRPENSQLDYFTKDNAGFTENSNSHFSGAQTATSECGTELSVSSTINSHDGSEAEGGEIVFEIGGLESIDAKGGSGIASESLNRGFKSLSASEIIQPARLEIININATELIAAVDSVQVEQQHSPEKHLAEPILSDTQVQQGNVIDKEACKTLPEGSPRSLTAALESHKTPKFSSTNKSQNERNRDVQKQRSQLLVKRSLSNLKNDLGGRSSTEAKSPKNGESRNSFGMPKIDHADCEPRASTSILLPNYMQTTESTKAKVHASNSAKPSLVVHDNDGYTRKRHSLPLGNGTQDSSPRIQKSPSQMQQNAKGTASRSPQSYAVFVMLHYSVNIADTSGNHGRVV